MKKLIIALVAGTTLMGVAQAQTPMMQRPYLGVGIATADRIQSLGGDGDWKAGFKLFGGYEMSDTLGIEAGWVDFGEEDYTVLTGGVANRVESDGESFYVAGRMNLPINQQFSAFGKLGISHNRAEQTASLSGFNRKDRDTHLYAGVGAQFKLSEQIALSVEYERFGKKQDFGPKPDVFTVAARYNF
ncbi:porin family protein [Massilia glaciei]|uniref:Porin family protein n=1 Tax=Massilia glaciei TaxID=1524097 RepID=A0A2U2I6Z9_9BURK|nr:porin family protein [Massilia glaciei]PWF55531.1 porin family protein [Massilia glaciei]